MMQVIVPPTVEPISAAQAFAELRIDPGDDITASPDYAEVVSLIREARAHCENLAGSAFVPQTIRFSPDRLTDWRTIELPRRPLLSIESVSYYGTDGMLTAIDSASYYAPALYVPSLYFVGGYSLPVLHERPDALRIDYVAGYAPTGADEGDPQYLASGVPEEIRRAIRLTMRLLYQSLDPREHEVTEKARDALLNSSSAKVWKV